MTPPAPRAASAHDRLRRRARRSPVAALTVIAALATASPGVRAGRMPFTATAPMQTVDTADLLATYERGDYDRVVQLLGETRDFLRLRRDLERTLAAGLKADAAAAAQRRAAAAALALEAARASFAADRDSATALLEWGCTLYREHASGPAAGERAWQVAALALMQGFHERTLLVEHLRHAGPRFPTDPHFDLARAWVLEAGTWLIASRRPDVRDVDEMKARTERVRLQRFSTDPADYRAARMWELAGLLERLASEPEIAVDARLRLGHTLYRLGEYPRALEELQEVDELSAEPFVRFLARLLTGRVRETMDDREAAIAAYTRALEIEPAAQSAAFALAGLLFVADRRADAAAVAGRALGNDRARDPWRSYQTVGFHRWPALIQAVRSSVHD